MRSVCLSSLALHRAMQPRYHGHLFCRRDYPCRTRILKQTSMDSKWKRTPNTKVFRYPRFFALQGFHAAICYILDGRGMRTQIYRRSSIAHNGIPPDMTCQLSSHPITLYDLPNLQNLQQPFSCVRVSWEDSHVAIPGFLNPQTLIKDGIL